MQFFTPLFTSLKTKRVSYSTQVGFVTHDDLVIGYLLEQVPVKIPTLDRVMSETYAIVGSRLSVNAFPGGCAPVPVPPLSSRQQWIDQLRHTVSQLHASGLGWSGAGPDQVLIDMDDNAWVIPGGCTQDKYDLWNRSPVARDLYALEVMEKGLLAEKARL